MVTIKKRNRAKPSKRDGSNEIPTLHASTHMTGDRLYSFGFDLEQPAIDEVNQIAEQKQPQQENTDNTSPYVRKKKSKYKHASDETRHIVQLTFVLLLGLLCVMLLLLFMEPIGNWLMKNDTENITQTTITKNSEYPVQATPAVKNTLPLQETEDILDNELLKIISSHD